MSALRVRTTRRRFHDNNLDHFHRPHNKVGCDHNVRRICDAVGQESVDLRKQPREIAARAASVLPNDEPNEQADERSDDARGIGSAQR